MLEESPKKSFSQKIAQYFKIFCIGSPEIHLPAQQKQEPIQRRTTIKKKRLTYLLDRAVVKLSRKNINVQQFSNKEVVSPDLEVYLGERLSSVTVALFQGNFTEKSLKALPLGIRLISKMPALFSPVNEILVLHNNAIKLRKGVVEALVVETNENIYQHIQNILKLHHGYIKHFIFICREDLDSAHLHELFVIFKDLYLFEIQRLMVLDKCTASVIYISRSHEFLKFNKLSIVEFYTAELVKKDPGIQKFDISSLFSQLLEANLYVQVASTLGQLMVTRKQIDHYDKQFIYLMHQRYPQSHPIIDNFLKSLSKQDLAISNNHVPKFHQNTPLFNQQKNENLSNEVQRGKSMRSKKSQVLHSFGVRPCNGMEWE